MFQLLKKIAVATLFMASVTAHAGVIVDVEEVNTYVGMWSSTTWTHDLSDNGLVLGSAQSADISIQFWDDQRRDLPELASIIIGSLDLQDGAIVYNPTSNWSGALGFNSIASLNAYGLLEVNVWSLFGDFYIGDSTLTVTTADVVSVPEASSLALLVLGLLSLVACRRKAII